MWFKCVRVMLCNHRVECFYSKCHDHCVTFEPKKKQKHKYLFTWNKCNWRQKFTTLTNSLTNRFTQITKTLHIVCFKAQQNHQQWQNSTPTMLTAEVTFKMQKKSLHNCVGGFHLNDFKRILNVEFKSEKTLGKKNLHQMKLFVQFLCE